MKVLVLTTTLAILCQSAFAREDELKNAVDRAFSGKAANISISGDGFVIERVTTYEKEGVRVVLGTVRHTFKREPHTRVTYRFTIRDGDIKGEVKVHRTANRDGLASVVKVAGKPGEIAEQVIDALTGRWKSGLATILDHIAAKALTM